MLWSESNGTRPARRTTPSESDDVNDHLIVIYLCGRCLWNSAAVCQPQEPPPRRIRCESCRVDGNSSEAEPIEGVLASRENCDRFQQLCQSLEPEPHREAMRLLASLRGRYAVVVTDWAVEQPLPAFDVDAFKRRVNDGE